MLIDTLCARPSHAGSELDTLIHTSPLWIPSTMSSSKATIETLRFNSQSAGVKVKLPTFVRFNCPSMTLTARVTGALGSLEMATCSCTGSSLDSEALGCGCMTMSRGTGSGLHIPPRSVYPASHIQEHPARHIECAGLLRGQFWQMLSASALQLPLICPATQEEFVQGLQWMPAL